VTSKPTTAFGAIVAALLVFGLSGCGVRGSLETPQAAGVPAADAANTANADSGQGKKAGEAAKPHKSFGLDWLLR
jgi:predicted small lipoprotein YifL